MTRRPLTDRLLCGVSWGVLDWCALESAVINRSNFQADDTSLAYGFLGRIRVWLELIFGGLFGREVSAAHVTYVAPTPPNRYRTRKHKAKIPQARRACKLACHIMRQRGYAACLQWVYNRSLTARIVWCFQDWKWRSLPLKFFAGCAGFAQMMAACGAPLRPD